MLRFSEKEYIEAGRFCLGPLAIHMSEPLPDVDLHEKETLVRKFDANTKRIPNIWNEDYHPEPSNHCIACLGLLLMSDIPNDNNDDESELTISKQYNILVISKT